MDATKQTLSETFFAAACEIDAIDLTPEVPAKPILEQLGPPPFAKMTFPMMGFLATVYEHVTGQFKGEVPRE